MADIPIERQKLNVVSSPADTVQEKKYDITATVADGATETVTIQPPAGRLWEVTKMEIVVPGTGGGSTHSVTVETEAEGVETSYGANNSASNYSYKSQGWNGTTTSRDDVEGTLLEPSDGIDVVYDNQSGADQTSTVEIRFQFKETKR